MQTLEQKWPLVYQQLLKVQEIAEKHYKDVCDIEFTVQDGRLFVQSVCRARRNTIANLRFALQFLIEGRITPYEVLERISTDDVADLISSTIRDQESLPQLGRGLPANAGAASGLVVFHVRDALELSRTKSPFIYVREEVSPDDLPAMMAAQGVVTLRGGISSHAALICRQLRKPCVVAYSPEDPRLRELDVHAIFQRLNWITIDGATGHVFAGKGNCQPLSWQDHPELMALAEIIDQSIRTSNVMPEVTGKIWVLHDFLRHSIPIRRGPTEKHPVWRKSFISFVTPRAPTLERLRISLTQLAPHERSNYGDILLPFANWIVRLLAEKVGIGSHFRYYRPLWDPCQTIVELDNRRTQFIGMEFHSVNQFVSKLIDVATVTLLIEVDLTFDLKPWFLDFTNPRGESLVVGSDSVLAYRLFVNDAEVRHLDVPSLYNSLRRRDYAWKIYETHGTSHAEIISCLAEWDRNKQKRFPLLPLCFELGLIRNRKLTETGKSLLGKQHRSKTYEFIAPRQDQ